jgi:hypothetical protein
MTPYCSVSTNQFNELFVCKICIFFSLILLIVSYCISH